MRHVEVEVLSEAVNNPVIRMPGRRFPGILIQGDSLSVLCGLAGELLRGIENNGSDDVMDVAKELRDLLTARLEHYEITLRAHHIELPY